MRAFTEVLGSGAPDASAALQLFFDDGRHVFECGDGTQRFCTERSVRLARLSGVYLTSLCAPSFGGLLGLLLTAADAGKGALTLCGPAGTRAALDAARRAAVCVRPALALRIVEAGVGGVRACEDGNVRVRAVAVVAGGSPGRVEDEVGEVAVSYVCRLRDLPGKFDVGRAKACGVPRGPLYGKLKGGEEVVLEGGRVVRPEDVVAASTPGPVVVVAACPAVRFVRAFMACGELKGGAVAGKGVVYHRCPREVLAAEEYRAWAAALGAGVAHVVLHAEVAACRLVFAAQAADLDALRKLDGKRFRTPWREGEGEDGEGGGEFVKRMCGAEWRVAESGARYVLAPAGGTGFDDDEVVEEVQVGVGGDSEAWRAVGDERVDGGEVPECVRRVDRSTAEVAFLGTAGAIPGKHRNVSGILLNLFARGCVLLDCGEGTVGQLVRAYGRARARDLLCGMRVAYVSHIHADHHLGLLSVIYERRRALRARGEADAAPLLVVGPDVLRAWLVGYFDAAYGGGEWFRFVDAQRLVEPQALDAQVFEDGFGLRLACAEVVHTSWSYGVRVTDVVGGWSVVYSGDTRPCRALGELGRGATLAIHEATLSDGMEREAVDKRHSTTSEALRVCGDWMQAWRTVLTHFSQRYPRVPVLSNAVMDKLWAARAVIAFDLMRVNFADLHAIPQIMPAVRSAFPADCYVEPPPAPDCACEPPEARQPERQPA